MIGNGTIGQLSGLLLGYINSPTENASGCATDQVLRKVILHAKDN